MRNIFFKVAIKTLVRSKKRAMATLVGIVISVSLITGTFVVSDTFQRFFSDITKSGYGNWVIASQGIEEKDLHDTRVSRKDYGVIKTLGYADLSIGDGKGLIKLGALDKNASKMIMESYAEGRAPRNTKEIALMKSTLDSIGQGYKVGDKIVLKVYKKGEDFSHNSEEKARSEDFENREFVISGIINPLKLNDGENDEELLLSWSNRGYKKGDEVLFDLPNLDTMDKVEKKLSSKGYRIKHNKELLSILKAEKNKSSGSIDIIAIVILLLVFIGGFMLIYNTFSISLRERKLAYKVMESIGATFKQRRRIPIYESVFFSLIGIPIGILFGLVWVQGIIDLFGDKIAKVFSNSGDVHMTLQLRWDIVMYSAGISFVIVFISSVFPYYREEIYREYKKKEGRSLFGLRDFGPFYLIGKRCGVEGAIAYRSFKKNRRYYKTTIASIGLTVFLLVASSGVMSYAQSVSKEMLGDSSSYDISYKVDESTKNIDDISQIFKRGKNIVEVGHLYKGKIEVEIGDLPVLYNLLVLDDNSYKRYLRENNVSDLDDDGDEVKLFADGKSTGKTTLKGVAISKITVYNTKTGNVESHNLFSGENRPYEMEGKIEGKNVNIKLSGYVDSRPRASIENITSPTIVTPYSEIKNIVGKSFNRNFSREIFIKSNNPEQTYKEAQTMVKNERLSPDGLINRYRDREDTNRAIIIIRIFSYGFIMLMSIITVANIFNTLSSNIQMKRIEIVSLISMGATDRDIIKSILIENTFIGVKGIICGILGALLFLLIPYSSLEVSGITGYIVPLTSVLVSILFVVASVLIVSWYIIGKLRKNTFESIITVLKENNL